MACAARLQESLVAADNIFFKVTWVCGPVRGQMSCLPGPSRRNRGFVHFGVFKFVGKGVSQSDGGKVCAVCDDVYERHGGRAEAWVVISLGDDAIVYLAGRVPLEVGDEFHSFGGMLVNVFFGRVACGTDPGK